MLTVFLSTGLSMDLSSQPLWVYLAIIGVVLAACAGYFAYRRAAARHQSALRLADESARDEAQRVAAQEAASRRFAEHAAQVRLAAQLEAKRLAEEEARVAAEAQTQARAAVRLAEETAAREKALRDAADRAQREARDEAARIEAARVAAAADAARARPAEPVVVKSPEQTLVMIADDSKVVRVKTGRLLALHHYQVAYAIDGLDAAQQLQTHLPDIVITDVEMPGMDGFELTRHVRQNPLTAHIPVIMITAADDKHRSEADRAGVSMLLGKPYPEGELIAYIQKAMNAGKPTAGVAI